jgi:hypothetical protein
VTYAEYMEMEDVSLDGTSEYVVLESEHNRYALIKRDKPYKPVKYVIG